LNYIKDKTFFPVYTQNGKWVYNTGWSNGFFIGQLWLLYVFTKEERYKDIALKLTERLDHFLKQNRFQDVGFLFYYSCAIGYNATGLNELRKKALEASDYLLDCLIEPQGYLYCNWKHDGDYVGVDQMMNLNLLLWAWENTKLYKYSTAIKKVIETTLKYLVTDSGRSVEYAKINSNASFEVANKNSEHSDYTWVRGHVWAIYGLLSAAISLSDPKVLQYGKKLAKFLLQAYKAKPFIWRISNLGDDNLLDTSAAAAAASIFTRTGKESNNKEDRAQFFKDGKSLLNELVNSHITNENSEHDGLLIHASSPLRIVSNPGESLVWGDYFILEAIYNSNK
ncbi:glycoside hydrolase family 88 protein, partial [bacterium]|nr:glycoside hydrolase family 88 protein [bacterium]